MVNNISNNRKVITQLEPHQAYETIGVFLAPDGNLEAQFKKMRTVAIAWADGLRTGTITKDKVWLALHSTILCTLIYPLLAIRLTKAQCEAILSPLLHYCPIGVCRFFPRKLVFSTADYMGLNLPHLPMLQDIARIQDLIFHTFNGALTGDLYRASLEIFVIEIGCNAYEVWRDSVIIVLLTTPSLV